MPFKYGGIFGGGGFNLDKLAYNYGAFLRTSPENFVSYFVTGMYGYNGVIIIPDFPQYNRTTIGTSFGAGFEINFKNDSRVQFSVLVPVRSNGFMDYYQSLVNNPMFEESFPLLPITISLGFKGRAF